MIIQCLAFVRKHYWKIKEYWHKSRYLKRLLSDNSVMKGSTRDDDVFILEIKERFAGNWKNIGIDRDILELKCTNKRLD